MRSTSSFRTRLLVLLGVVMLSAASAQLPDLTNLSKESEAGPPLESGNGSKEDGLEVPTIDVGSFLDVLLENFRANLNLALDLGELGLEALGVLLIDVPLAIGSGLVSGITWTLDGVVLGTQGLGHGVFVAMDGIWSVLGIMVSWSLDLAGLLIGSVWAAYVSLVQLLKPDGMGQIAFDAMAISLAFASLGVAGFAVTTWLRGLGLLGAVGGFSRIERHELLTNDTRARIHDLIVNNPGIHPSALSRLAGLGWGTISHHLDKLRKGDLVTLRQINGQNCYFSYQQPGWQEMQLAGAVKGMQASRIAAFVADHPGASQKDIASALDLSPALVSFHSRKLVNLGVIEAIRQGRSNLLQLSQEARSMLRQDRTLLDHWRQAA